MRKSTAWGLGSLILMTGIAVLLSCSTQEPPPTNPTATASVAACVTEMMGKKKTTTAGSASGGATVTVPSGAGGGVGGGKSTTGSYESETDPRDSKDYRYTVCVCTALYRGKDTAPCENQAK